MKTNPEDLELQRTYTPDNRRVWHSCCLTCDKDVVQYITKYSMLVLLMGFFSVELHLSETCEQTQLFTGLLTMIVGVALPNPKLK